MAVTVYFLLLCLKFSIIKKLRVIAFHIPVAPARWVARNTLWEWSLIWKSSSHIAFL